MLPRDRFQGMSLVILRLEILAHRRPLHSSLAKIFALAFTQSPDNVVHENCRVNTPSSSEHWVKLVWENFLGKLTLSRYGWVKL